ncbi:hypothetical protein AArcMg_0599 [Natrarchaeobaculum sulfurireducens]|uniref:Uncharacterized protein n=2 Tax=Natrarchaeobaculum sulfurireducens TaxID=2044521 RepID=A0A346PBR0_9EURY|nr:hypothetical protein AArc1_0611 [Natrarchaeobaculum sulfurireducens]AXR80622.1 hypothetical protein AArcMg_0599 [Natrarchaeobaculum sulfurireducens]
MVQRDGDDRRSSRRSFLSSIGVTGGMSFLAGGSVLGSRWRNTDSDDDGIPDRKKRSTAFHRRLESVFGPDQFEGLEPGRPTLLIDVRYIGQTAVFPSTKWTVVNLFRRHGIDAQWLEYPHRYALETVTERYGSTVRDLLWRPGCFYSEEVETDLKDVALQLLIVPGASTPPHEGRIYSHVMDLAGGDADGYVNGFSAGNRAVVANRTDRFAEARLVLHELAHLALGHDDDPTNPGVMGSGEEVDLLDAEWNQLRGGLANIRDRTGYDVVFRPCLWFEDLASSLE